MRARPSRAARRPVIARSIAPVPSVGVASSKNLRRAEGISARTGRNRLQSAPAWARLRAMSSRARLSARLALATVVLPSLAFAQDNIVPFGQEESARADHGLPLAQHRPCGARQRDLRARRHR